MSMQDPVADMLTRMRNGQMATMLTVSMPHSKLKQSIAALLEKEGYIAGFSVVELENNKRDLSVELKYYKGKPVIERIQRVSRPGLRKYAKSQDIPKVKGGLGVAVVSTPRGLMTDRQARQANLGGELMFIVE